ncbi:MAG: hypothetical protein JNL38_19745 [Myxococcales bacterium]|jgi:hypothetical protein|nr:hypothetical protein [Myxococcales bacterium]
MDASAWKVESLRVTLMCAQPLAIEASKVFDAVRPGEPQETQTAPLVHAGVFGEEVLQVQLAEDRARIDVVVGPRPKVVESGIQSLAGGATACVERLGELARHTLRATEHGNRLALGLVLLRQVESVEGGNVVVREKLPEIAEAVTRDATDLAFQLSTPVVVDGKTTMNLFERWNVHRIDRVAFAPTGMRHAPPTFVVRHELDYNTPVALPPGPAVRLFTHEDLEGAAADLLERMRARVTATT